MRVWPGHLGVLLVPTTHTEYTVRVGRDGDEHGRRETNGKQKTGGANAGHGCCGDPGRGEAGVRQARSLATRSAQPHRVRACPGPKLRILTMAMLATGSMAAPAADARRTDRLGSEEAAGTQAHAGPAWSPYSLQPRPEPLRYGHSSRSHGLHAATAPPQPASRRRGHPSPQPQPTPLNHGPSGSNRVACTQPPPRPSPLPRRRGHPIAHNPNPRLSTTVNSRSIQLKPWLTRGPATATHPNPRRGSTAATTDDTGLSPRGTTQTSVEARRYYPLPRPTI